MGGLRATRWKELEHVVTWPAFPQVPTSCTLPLHSRLARLAHLSGVLPAWPLLQPYGHGTMLVPEP